MTVHVALIRESDAIMRPTKVVTLAHHLAALAALKAVSAGPGTTPGPAHYPFTTTHQESPQ